LHVGGCFPWGTNCFEGVVFVWVLMSRVTCTAATMPDPCCFRYCFFNTIGQNTNGENTIGQTVKISNWSKYTGTLGTNITIVLRQNHEMMPKGGRRLPPVEANQSMLNQVLMNLIFNARDAIR
jgi:hypothetical protein